MKRIVFLTGTRADFGKLKSLIKISQAHKDFEVHIFVTGMHMNALYGATVDEIYKTGFSNIYQFINHDTIEYMDRTLAKTIDGFSKYVNNLNPDLILVHGDRVEALAGAIVASLNNILVAHIEGGEISGTIDELIRHAVTKMSHIHLVANNEAKKRLIQLGEYDSSIFILGSPDLDLMKEEFLPEINFVKEYYDIKFKEYSIAIFHSVTTEYNQIHTYIKKFVNALIQSNRNYIIIYPNNDLGSIEILHEYKRLKKHKNFRIFPSIRFEFFLSLLRKSSFIIGNSSAGIREAPFYNLPTINIGNRQNNRATFDSIKHCTYETEDILNTINNISSVKNIQNSVNFQFGDGESDKMFLKLLKSEKLWQVKYQKQFQEISYEK